MYHIASGKPSFCELLRQFEQQALTLAHPATPVCVGWLMTAQNGALYLSFECELINGKPKHDNPAEMDFACVREYGEKTSPMREWFQTAISDDNSLVTEEGRVILHPEGSHVFATPIFDAVCRWTDEFFRRPEAAFAPAWLIVDDIDAGLYRAWQLGELIIP